MKNKTNLILVSLVFVFITITGIGFVIGKEGPTLSEDTIVFIDEDDRFKPEYKDRIGYGGVIYVEVIDIDDKIIVEPGKSYQLTFSLQLKPIHEYCTSTTLEVAPNKGLRITQEGGGLPIINLNKMIDYHVDKITLFPEKEVLINATLTIPESAPIGKIPLRAVGIGAELPLLDNSEVDIIVVT